MNRGFFCNPCINISSYFLNFESVFSIITQNFVFSVAKRVFSAAETSFHKSRSHS